MSARDDGARRSSKVLSPAGIVFGYVLMAESRDAQIVKKVKKLSEIAEGLRQGEDFPITRLTTIKSLCGIAGSPHHRLVIGACTAEPSPRVGKGSAA
jgi:hypothetical protein